MKATAIVIELGGAAASRNVRRPAARPFQGALLKGFAASLDKPTLARIRAAVAGGFSAGVTTQEIVRQIVRNDVSCKARAAL